MRDQSDEPEIPGLASLSMVVTPDATIRDCLRAIDRGQCSTALAVEGRRLIGLVTDGDIRRALLDGASLDDPVTALLRRTPVTVGPHESRSAVLDLMKARSIAQIPVVDGAGTLLGIHLMSHLLGRTPRPNVAMVLAGGRGTRLGELSRDIPKPMMPVAGRPILDRLITHLVGFGISRVVLAVGHLAQVIEQHFGDGTGYGCEITYLREMESEPLGTGGPLRDLAKDASAVAHPILVLNGDLVTQFDVGALLEHHNCVGADLTVAVHDYVHQIPYGVVELAPDGYIAEVSEKPYRRETVNAGIYVFSPAFVDHMPPGRQFPITELVANLISAGTRVAAWRIDSSWIDVGRPEDLASAQGRPHATNTAY